MEKKVKGICQVPTQQERENLDVRALTSNEKKERLLQGLERVYTETYQEKFDFLYEGIDFNNEGVCVTLTIDDVFFFIKEGVTIKQRFDNKVAPLDLDILKEKIQKAYSYLEKESNAVISISARFDTRKIDMVLPDIRTI